MRMNVAPRPGGDRLPARATLRSESRTGPRLARKMRIALFTDTYLPSDTDLAHTLGQLVVHAFDRGDRVALVSPDDPGKPAHTPDLHYRLPRLPRLVHPELRLTRLLDRRGRKMLEAFEPDVVHVATESTVGWSGRKWAAHTGIPLVTSFHHTNLPVEIASARSLIVQPRWSYLRFFHRRARLTLVASEESVERLAARGFHDRMRVWPRGVDPGFFHPKRRRPDIRRRLGRGAAHIVLHVGDPANDGTAELLGDVFEVIRMGAPGPVSLVVAGADPVPGTLGKETKERGAGVRFLPSLTADELADAYAAADLLLVPRERAKSGTLAVQAAASGLPVVASGGTGASDVIDHGETGIRVPPDDPLALAAASLHLIWRDQERRAMGRTARETSLEHEWARTLDPVFAAYACAVRASKRQRTGRPEGPRSNPAPPASASPAALPGKQGRDECSIALGS